MLIPVKAVHNAALALSEQGDISQTMFEDAYHCRVGMSTNNENYWIHFDSEKDATAFLMRWM